MYELHTKDIGGPRAAASLVAAAQDETPSPPFTPPPPPPPSETDGLGGEVSSDPSLSVAPVAGEDLVKHCLQRQVAFAADARRAAALRKFIADYRLHL